MIKERNDYEKRLWLLGAMVLAAAMLLHFAVNRLLTVYSDDYWYGTFFQNGLRGFLRHTAEHYRNTNGRVLIHILIPILLLADTKAFAALSPVLTALLFVLGLRVQNRRLKGGGLLLAGGLGVLSVLGSEIQYLRMSLYWLSAYFNYAFPLIFPLAVLWGMERARENRNSPLGAAALGVCAFLAGASTEQCGVVSLILVAGYWLLQVWRQGPARNRLYWYPLLTALGYLTILTAPGSRARMNRGIEGGIFSVLDPAVFRSRFFDVMHYLCGCAFWNALFAAFCLLVGLLCLANRGLPRHLLSGIPAAAAVAALAVMGWESPLAVLTVLYTLYVAVTFLLYPAYRVTGLLLLGGGASVMMLIITTLYYARTFFPCVLIFLMVCWSLLFQVLAHAPASAAVVTLAALAAVFLVRYVPIYRGYAANQAVIQQNLQAVEACRRGEPLQLSIDLDPDYRFTVFFEGSYFLENFLQYYQLPSNTPVRFTSEIWDVSGLESGGQTSAFPALEKDGQLLFPIEFPFRNTGGACDFRWTDHTFAITCGGKSYTLREDGQLFLNQPGGGGSLVDGGCTPQMPFSFTYTQMYLSAEDFARCFGITFDYDAGSDSYTPKVSTQ